uniref:SOS-response transcriptional repressor, LexA n=1 Tax=Agathobacter rectalis (strain ATCC 33656 / DSM 3377 / JCM 17463 / KCTC 5835 / VPI 0990) TaxID=515619 RepID=UPI0001BE62C4|nr:Chain A, SOS-response transcriptional repressor, LexA [Agathobacter rectalis ATCC 33656]
MVKDKQKAIFSENLNSYIAKSEKTQLEIAKSIGVSPQTFNTWCKGIAIPRMGKVQALADYFNINKSDLIEDKKLNIDTVPIESGYTLEHHHHHH